MGKFRVDITITNTNGEKEILSYNENQLVDFNTNSFVFSNVTRPIFDSYPNEGTVVIKDINLDLYNRALNGDFDNTYNFEVQIYKGNEIIAEHIVNQRPQYNFANKTLTLQLGNEIDNFPNIITNGIEYNFETKDFKELLTEFLKQNNYEGYNGYSSYDMGNVLRVPYLPQTTFKDGLRQILECIGCSLYKNPKDIRSKVRIERLLDDDYSSKPIYKILPKHISYPFLPTIILDNKFTNIKLNAKNVNEKIENKTFFIKTFKGVEELNPTISYIEKYSSVGTFEFVAIAHRKQINSKCSFEIPKKYNDNLGEVLSINFDKYEEGKFNGNNPSYSFTNRIKTYNFVGKYNKIGDPIDNEGNTGIQNISIDTSDTSLWQLVSNNIEETGDISSTSFSYNYGTETDAKYQTVTLDLPKYYEELTELYSIPANRYELLSDGKYKYYVYIIIGKTYLTQASIADKATVSVKTRQIQLIKSEPISLTVSVRGTTKEIVFDNETVASTENNLNVYESANENYFLQKGLGYINENEIAKKVVNNIQNFYKNGVRVGTISTIFSNYIPSHSVFNEQKTKDQPFEIGDLVIPCKDNFGNPIISKPYKRKDVIEENITGTTGDNGYTDIFGDTHYTYSFSKAYWLPIKDIIISNVSSNAKVSYSISNNGKTLEITLTALLGKSRVSCDVSVFIEDNNTYNIPVVYKVVGNRIENNGGAGNQNLTLMEVPLNYIYDIPDLVENDNIETISNDIIYDNNVETKEDLPNQNENLNTDLEGL